MAFTITIRGVTLRKGNEKEKAEDLACLKKSYPHLVKYPTNHLWIIEGFRSEVYAWSFLCILRDFVYAVVTKESPIGKTKGRFLNALSFGLFPLCTSSRNEGRKK